MKKETTVNHISEERGSQININYKGYRYDTAKL